MNRISLALLICLMGIGQICLAKPNIKITVKQMPNKNIILAHYYDGKIYAADTARLDANGVGYFKNKDLASGMYLLLFSNSNYFEILIGKNQKFSIQADTAKTIETFRIEGSPENQAFLDLQKFMLQQTLKSRDIKEIYNKETDKESAEIKEKYTCQFNEVDNEMRVYITNLANLYPGTALATFANFTLSAEIPDFSKKIPEGTPDREREIQRQAYFYRKAHFWDHTNFSDSTLLRTPIFRNKLDDYFNNMVVVHPDSVYKECVNVVERTRKCPEMFRYMVNYCFNYTYDSKIMGMDEAFVNVCKKYFLTKQTPWIDKENMKKIEEEVMKLEYNLIGHKALDLRLPTIDGNQVSLLETKAPFTVLLFWEYSCGHCKKEVPAIKTEIYDKFKAHGLKVFAVHTKNDKPNWEKFVADHDLFDFINCWDPHRQSNYWTIYNVFQTPVFYLLDKDKKIIAKKLSIEQTVDILKREYQKMGIEVQ